MAFIHELPSLEGKGLSKEGMDRQILEIQSRVISFVKNYNRRNGTYIQNLNYDYDDLLKCLIINDNGVYELALEHEKYRESVLCSRDDYDLVYRIHQKQGQSSDMIYEYNKHPDIVFKHSLQVVSTVEEILTDH